MAEQAPRPGSTSNHDRLNGWKEIAAYLGKSVSTVQRWEREIGLAVHRIRTSGGEIVFAYRSELDKWLAEGSQASSRLLNRNGLHEEQTTEAKEAERVAEVSEKQSAQLVGGATPESESGGSRWWVATAAVVIMVTMLWAGWRSGIAGSAALSLQKAFAGHADPQPAYYHVEDNTLKVFNARSEELWEHRFEFEIDKPRYEEQHLSSLPQFVQLEDLDQDGQKELLFVSYSARNEQNKLYCFNSDGSVRFVIQPSEIMKFGGEEFAPPYLVRGFLISTDGAGRKVIWVISLHNLWFPSVVQKVSPNGEVLGEYWSNGHINNVRAAIMDGRGVLLVGAMNNELWAGTLAAIDYDNPSGSAPAISSKYRCENCPGGTPLSYLVFPRMEISKELNARPSIREIRAEPNGNFIVSVVQGGLVTPPREDVHDAGVFYTLNIQLELLAAETSDMYREVHLSMELAGRLNHRYGPACEKELLPLLSWKNGKFAKITANAAPERNLAQALVPGIK